MSVAAHHIRRQLWRVTTDSPHSALAWRQALRSQLDTVILPAFERAFQSQNPRGGYVTIPRLTIHLQVAANDLVRAGFGELIETQVRIALARSLAEVQRADAQTGEVPGGVSNVPEPGDAGEFQNSAARGAVSGARDRWQQSVVLGSASGPRASSQSEAEYWRQALIEYLLTGLVRWDAMPSQGNLLPPALADAAEQLVDEPAILADLLKTASDRRISLSFRLLQLLKPATSLRLIRIHVDPTTVPIDWPLERLVQRADWEEPVRLHLLAVLLACSGRRARELSQEIHEALRPLVAEWSMRPDLSGNELVHSVRQWLLRLAPETTASQANSEGAQERGEGPSHPESSAAVPLDRKAHDRDGVGSSSTEMLLRAGTGQTRERGDGAGMGVEAAGLILLHPFLPTLFQAAGIVAAGTHVLETRSLSRAAALMYWVASGRNEVFEFELPLIKVLLGLTPADPLPVARGLLDDADRQEAEALLQAVIDHWTALGRTSLDGLRESFLCRRGLLRADDECWRLQVEGAAFDMLLARLPWEISYVKLPWMKRPIITDWPTP